MSSEFRCQRHSVPSLNDQFLWHSRRPTVKANTSPEPDAWSMHDRRRYREILTIAGFFSCHLCEPEASLMAGSFKPHPAPCSLPSTVQKLIKFMASKQHYHGTSQNTMRRILIGLDSINEKLHFWSRNCRYYWKGEEIRNSWWCWNPTKCPKFFQPLRKTVTHLTPVCFNISSMRVSIDEVIKIYILSCWSRNDLFGSYLVFIHTSKRSSCNPNWEKPCGELMK